MDDKVMGIVYLCWLLLTSAVYTEHDKANNVEALQHITATLHAHDVKHDVSNIDRATKEYRSQVSSKNVLRGSDKSKVNAADSAAVKYSDDPNKLVADALIKGTNKNEYICPKGVKAFAAESKKDYYYCGKEGEDAILKKCTDGATYNPGMETCHFPSATKRSAEMEFLYEPVFGHQVYLGDLFDATSNRILTGVSFWKDETIKKDKRRSMNTNSKVAFSAAKTSFERISKLKVSAELKLSFLGGLIEVEGSARYLKDSVESLDYASFSMEYAAKSFYETLPIFTPIDYTELCDDVKEIKATHVVSTIQYGLNAYFEFFKRVTSEQSKEEIEGNLRMAVHLIPGFDIKGEVSAEVEGEIKRMGKNINVKLFGDFILDRQPTTYEEAVHVFQHLPKYLGKEGKYEKSSKMKMILTPITLYCKDSDMILNSISTSLINEVTKMLGALEETKIVAKTLRVSEPAKRFLPIAHNLDHYLNAIQMFVIKMQSQLQEILPKIRGGSMNAGEGNLTSLLTQYRQSPFHEATSKLFLDIRKREVNVIQLILNKLRRGSDDIVITNYVDANDAKIHLNQKHILVMEVNCLPTLNVTESFLNLRRVEHNVAWFDNKTILGFIGKQFDKFIDFVTINNEKSHGYIVELAKSSNTPIRVHARKSGEELTSNFLFPKKPVMVVDGNISTTHESFSFRVNKPHNPFIKGLKVHYWNIAGNSSGVAKKYVPFNINNQFQDVTVDGLYANIMYSFLMIYVTEMGDSPPSDESSEIWSRPSSEPTNIKKQRLSSTEVRIGWDEPNYIGEGVIINRYNIRVTGDRYLSTKSVDSVRSATFLRLTPATKYTVSIAAVNKNSRAKSLESTFIFITLPRIPIPPNVAGVGYHDVNLTWSTPIIARGGTIQGYHLVYYKVNNYGNRSLGSEIGITSQNTRFKIADLVQGTKYSVKVKVLTDLGDSPYSRPTIFQTKFRESDLDRLRSSFQDEISYSVAAEEQRLLNIIHGMNISIIREIDGLNRNYNTRITGINNSMTTDIAGLSRRITNNTESISRGVTPVHGMTVDPATRDPGYTLYRDYRAIYVGNGHGRNSQGDDDYTSASTSSLRECIAACRSRRNSDSTINGVQYTPGGSCFCEKSWVTHDSTMTGYLHYRLV